MISPVVMRALTSALLALALSVASAIAAGNDPLTHVTVTIDGVEVAVDLVVGGTMTEKAPKIDLNPRLGAPPAPPRIDAEPLTLGRLMSGGAAEWIRHAPSGRPQVSRVVLKLSDASGVLGLEIEYPGARPVSHQFGTLIDSCANLVDDGEFLTLEVDSVIVMAHPDPTSPLPACRYGFDLDGDGLDLDAGVHYRVLPGGGGAGGLVSLELDNVANVAQAASWINLAFGPDRGHRSSIKFGYIYWTTPGSRVAADTFEGTLVSFTPPQVTGGSSPLGLTATRGIAVDCRRP